MKTCNFRDAHPRLFGKNADEPEGILCQAEPVARYGMTPCYEKYCFLCRQERKGLGERKSNDDLSNVTVHFSSNQVHQFVNKYIAILNCPAVSAC
jgi:hypothetical protein